MFAFSIMMLSVFVMWERVVDSDGRPGVYQQVNGDDMRVKMVMAILCSLIDTCAKEGDNMYLA